MLDDLEKRRSLARRNVKLILPQHVRSGTVPQ